MTWEAFIETVAREAEGYIYSCTLAHLGNSARDLERAWISWFAARRIFIPRRVQRDTRQHARPRNTLCRTRTRCNWSPWARSVPAQTTSTPGLVELAGRSAALSGKHAFVERALPLQSRRRRRRRTAPLTQGLSHDI